MEWISQLIGFLIVVFVFSLPLLRKFLIDRKQKKKVPQTEEIEPRIEIDEVIEEDIPPAFTAPPIVERQVRRDFSFQTDLESHELESELEKRKLGTRVAPRFDKKVISKAFIFETKRQRRRFENPIVIAYKKRDPLQAMVILSEIFGPPKSDEPF